MQKDTATSVFLTMKSLFKCPLCGGNSYRHYLHAKDRMFELPGAFTFVKCLNCSGVSLYPMLSRSQVSSYYPVKKYYAYNSQGKKSFFTMLRTYLVRANNRPTLLGKILTMLLPQVPAIPHPVTSGKILDVGCGVGDTLMLLKELGWETFGMDIDEAAVAMAKKRGVDHVRIGFYQDISSYPDHYFDAVRLYHVIEHLDDPVRCLRLVKKKLKKGGQLIIGTPNAESSMAHLFGTYWYNLDAPRHLILFSPRTLRQAVVKSGFRVTRVEFCSVGGLLGSIQYVLREKFGINLNLIHTQWLVLLFYPLEWLIDRMNRGDVFVLRATP